MVILRTPTNRFTLAYKVNRNIIVFVLIVFLNITAPRGSRISGFRQFEKPRPFRALQVLRMKNVFDVFFFPR